MDRNRKHGTRSMYMAGCRCKSCTVASTSYERARRENMRKHPRPVKEHGTVLGYNYGCRRECCKAAKRAANAAYRKRVQEGGPTTRELERQMWEQARIAFH